MTNLINNIKHVFGLPVAKTAEDRIFDSSSAINAKSAYMTTKYGRDKTQQQLLQDFFTNANDLIKSKTMRNEYCCMIEVDEDIKAFVPRILKRFHDDLGYNVIVIDNNTEIKQGDKTVKVNPNSTFVILMWNAADITEPVFPDEDSNDHEYVDCMKSDE